MGRFRNLLVASVGALGLIVGGSAVVSAHGTHDFLTFDSMTPVTGSAVGNPNDRGIVGGGLPWAIDSGKGELDRDGTVRVRVDGLVIPVAPFNGTNPAAKFGVTVSCLDAQGHPHNIKSTSLFNASPEGDSRIVTKVALPQVCNEPIVFVTSPGGAWFAMSNAGDEG